MASQFENSVDEIYIVVYTASEQEVLSMMTAKIFENGRSQAVRLPKEFRFDTPEVAINRIGSIVLLMPPADKWSGFLQSLDMFSDDYMQEGRADDMTQKRESL